MCIFQYYPSFARITRSDVCGSSYQHHLSSIFEAFCKSQQAINRFNRGCFSARKGDDVENVQKCFWMDNAGLNSRILPRPFRNSRTDFVTWVNWNRTVYFMRVLGKIPMWRIFFADAEASLRARNRNCFNKFSSKGLESANFQPVVVSLRNCEKNVSDYIF